MKNLLVLITVLIVTSSIAQIQGINYKAIIKDANGEVLPNTPVALIFEIEDLAEVSFIAYAESHQTATDNNGIVIVKIGEGSPIGTHDYNDINWGSIHKLYVEVDTGSGFVELGGTLLKNVPYAEHAEAVRGQAFKREGSVIKPQSITDDFIVGSKQMDNDPTTSDDNSRVFFNKERAAFRAGKVSNSNWDLDSLGFNSFASGLYTKATGSTTTAMGSETEASGTVAIAMGNVTRAKGDVSTAMGFLTQANGDESTAMGSNTRANGISSTAMGSSTHANGKSSTSMGVQTKAGSYASTAIGRHNIGGGNTTQWIPTDPVFEIGNGYWDGVSWIRRNALTILKNGKVGLGSYAPTSALQIDYNSSITSAHLSLKESAADYARINFSNQNRPGEYWAVAGFVGNTLSADRLNFFNSDVGDIMSIHGTGNIYVNGALAHSSDRRLKTDIEDLSSGLNEVLQLQPKTYYWKDKPDQKNKSIGLIAQDVQEVISSIVHQGDDADTTLSISYTELIPVLINAIKEQQAIISKLNTAKETQTAELLIVQQNYKALLLRIESLEGNISN